MIFPNWYALSFTKQIHCCEEDNWKLRLIISPRDISKSKFDPLRGEGSPSVAGPFSTYLFLTTVTPLEGSVAKGKVLKSSFQNDFKYKSF